LIRHCSATLFLCATLALIGISVEWPGAAQGLSLGEEPIAEFHIGYQKGGPSQILKSSGTLERRLASLQVHVRWAEFPSAPPLLEALNAGALELGVAGNAATVFAQAATDSQLIYLTAEVPNERSEAILIPKDSKLASLADLKGKTIAFTRASYAHYLLIRALEKAHLGMKEIRQAGLSPIDARTAFESGSVDAWVIWGPFDADAQLNLGAKVLADGSGLVDDFVFYVSTRFVADKHPHLLEVVIDEIAKAEQWMQAHPDDAAAQLSDATGLPQISGRPPFPATSTASGGLTKRPSLLSRTLLTLSMRWDFSRPRKSSRVLYGALRRGEHAG